MYKRYDTRHTFWTLGIFSEQLTFAKWLKGRKIVNNFTKLVHEWLFDVVNKTHPDRRRAILSIFW